MSNSFNIKKSYRAVNNAGPQAECTTSKKNHLGLKK